MLENCQERKLEGFKDGKLERSEDRKLERPLSFFRALELSVFWAL
jgi:hypothetical protein